MTALEDWSVVVIVRTATGVVSVKEISKTARAPLWVMPGGRKKPGENTWQETAANRLLADTNITVAPEQFRLIEEVQGLARRTPEQGLFNLYLALASPSE